MLNISKGIVLRPQKVVVYGPEGIGKSTFASHFPDPLFLDIEDSTSQLDVKRIPDINSWAMLHGIIEEIAKEKPCKTLVIDTVDWAEKLCIQYVCAQAKKSSIEDFAYGSGYTKLMEAFARFLEALNEVTRAGINVVLNAHAQIRKFEQPDEMGAYDRWELKLNSKTTNKTAALRVKYGLTTREREAAEMTGSDLEENLEQIAYEQDLIKNLGIDEGNPEVLAGIRLNQREGVN